MITRENGEGLCIGIKHCSFNFNSLWMSVVSSIISNYHTVHIFDKKIIVV